MIALVVCAGLSASTSEQTRDGATAFQAVREACHAQPAPDSRAPTLDALRQFAPESILTALITGRMFRTAQALSDAEKRSVAEFIAGRPIGAPMPANTIGRCASPAGAFKLSTGPSWNGWPRVSPMPGASRRTGAG